MRRIPSFSLHIYSRFPVCAPVVLVGDIRRGSLWFDFENLDLLVFHSYTY